MIADLIFVGGAAWIVAHCLVFLDGPFGVIRWLRVLVGAQAANPYDPEPDGQVAKLLRCMYCTAFWTALAMFGLWHVVPEAVEFMAAWAVAAFIHALISSPAASE